MTAPVGPRVVTLATVASERVDWLWPGRLPLGKTVVLDGDPSLGKSTLSLDFAARLSTGKSWPDGTPCDVGDTVLLSAEDGLADTIRPRLEAAGADCTKVHALTEITYVDGEGRQRSRPVTLGDIEVIEAVIRERSAKLLIIDVLMAYLGQGVDSHRDQDVRSVLHRLAAMAERTGCCLLLLRHLNKAGQGSAMYRGGGSIGIIGAARAAFVVAPDPDDDTRRVFAPTKANLAVMPEALVYRLVTAGEVARVQWEGTSVRTATELLRPPAGDEESPRDEAQAFLRDLLEFEPLPAKTVLAKARDAGHSERTVKRAKAALGVKSRKVGVGPDTRWLWELRAKGAKGSTTEGRHPWPPSGATVTPIRRDDDL